AMEHGSEITGQKFISDHLPFFVTTQNLPKTISVLPLKAEIRTSNASIPCFLDVLRKDVTLGRHELLWLMMELHVHSFMTFLSTCLSTCFLS
ncbi:MAG: hypothetical protein ACI4NC_09995, partial [Succinivibrio sp.]